MSRRGTLATLALVLMLGAAGAAIGAPLASLDLTRAEDLAAAAGSWRTHEARLVPVSFRQPGGDGQPGTAPSQSFDVEPRAGARGFDDTGWTLAAPETLAARRGPGKVSFLWYRLRLTEPEALAGVATAGHALELEVEVDDAAEVWVDGELRRCPGQRGGTMVAGWNAPNRVVVAPRTRPGREHEIAIFGINGPISGSPTNYVYLRRAALELVPARETGAPEPVCELNVEVERETAGIDRLITWNPKLFTVPGSPRIDTSPRLSDAWGNLWEVENGDVVIRSAEGRRLGRVRAPREVRGLAWAAEGGGLLLAGEETLYRLATKVGAATATAELAERIVKLDRRFERLIPAATTLERLASGFHWLEGPAWDRRQQALFFTDIPANTVYRLRAGEPATVFLQPSGYTGSEPFTGREPGANGLTFDAEGRLLLCEHGDRRVSRLENDGSRTTLADRYEGKRLNSPNDVITTKAGDVYFTDPPFGLPGGFTDPARELPWAGVYRRTPDGTLELLTQEVEAPNGLALSPDGKTLYVSNADAKKPVVYRFDVLAPGKLGRREIFFDAAPWATPTTGQPDGIKVDRDGNVFLAGPGGLHVLSPKGEHLGWIRFDVPLANLAWGEDGTVLYLAADTAIWRLRTGTRGAGWNMQQQAPRPGAP